MALWPLNSTHDFRFGSKCGQSGASKTEVLDNIVSASCPKRIDLNLIERIARAMCKADGNDPDRLCLVHASLPHLRGLASSFQIAPQTVPSREVTQASWKLYASAAETAILELEAAAMDGDRAHAGDGNTGAPWYPPHLFYVKGGKVSAVPDHTESREVPLAFASMKISGVETTHDFRVTDNCARCGVRREPVVDNLVSHSCPYAMAAEPVFVDPLVYIGGDGKPQTVTWSEQQDFTDWSVNPVPARPLSGKSADMLIVDDLLAPDDSPEHREAVSHWFMSNEGLKYLPSRVHEADEPGQVVIGDGVPLFSGRHPTSTDDLDVSPAPKDAPLLEALRKQREKDGF
jgi:hypothetical protein